MKNYRTITKHLFYFSALFIFSISAAQDKIYKTDGSVFDGKVIRVEPMQIEVTVPDGPKYYFRQRDIDSVVYENWRHEKMGGYLHKMHLRENIPQLNTWTIDLAGFGLLSVTQSYERRLKNGKIGFRVPLYIGFIGGGVAGIGTFKPGLGVYNPSGAIYSATGNGQGHSLATGINPKFYLFKRRVIRVFAGPEADIGYSEITGYVYDKYHPQGHSYPSIIYRCGTIAMLGSFGLSINPKDKFNITIHGAAGAGNVFGSNNPIGWTGLWQIGFSMGANF